MQDQLTDLQHQIVTIVVRDSDYPPTAADIASELHRSPGAVASALRRLAELRWVEQAGVGLNNARCWAPFGATGPSSRQDAAASCAVFDSDGRFVAWTQADLADDALIAHLRATDRIAPGIEVEILKACGCRPPSALVDCVRCWPLDEQ